jgi:hypothetical protein
MLFEASRLRGQQNKVVYSTVRLPGTMLRAEGHAVEPPTRALRAVACSPDAGEAAVLAHRGSDGRRRTKHLRFLRRGSC